MTCDRHDQELLLLAHGELTPARRLAVCAHLRRCPSCKARYANLTRVSSVLASAIRAPGSPPWSPRFASQGASALSFGSRLLLVFAALLTVGICLFAFHAAARRTASRGAAGAFSAQKGCAPNLPSDQCR